MEILLQVICELVLDRLSQDKTKQCDLGIWSCVNLHSSLVENPGSSPGTSHGARYYVNNDIIAGDHMICDSDTYV